MQFFKDQNISLLQEHSLNLLISFNDNHISLNIPEGMEIEGGWKLKSLTPLKVRNVAIMCLIKCLWHLQILKSDVDRCVDGIIPHCKLFLSHSGRPTTSLMYELPLSGASMHHINLFLPYSEVIQLSSLL